MPSAVGVLVAVLIIICAGPAIAWTLAVLRDGERPLGVWHTAESGFLERIILAAAVYVGSPELVAGWLVLKAASGWRGWARNPGVFNLFATGTGLSLLAAAAAAAFLRAEDAAGWSVAGALALGFVVALCVLIVIDRGDVRVARLFDPEASRRSNRGTLRLRRGTTPDR